MLSILLELAKKKPWLREECGWVILCAIREVQGKNADQEYVRLSLELLHEQGLVKTLEGVAIFIVAKDCFPAIEFSRDAWKYGHPLHAGERAALAKIMKESSSSPGESAANEGPSNDGDAKHDIQNKGVWSPKLHFAWSIVLRKLFENAAPDGNNRPSKGDSDSKHTPLSFVDFWHEVVNNGLFANAASDERKYWGFLLVNKILNEAPTPFAVAIFTPNVTRCLRNQLASEERYLHRIALKASKAVQARASRDQDIIAPAVAGLMSSGNDGGSGPVNFDQVTRTKTVEKLLCSASTAVLGEALPLFEKMIMKPGTDDAKQAATTRLFISNLLGAVVKAQVHSSSSSSSSDSSPAQSEEFASFFQSLASMFSRFGFFNGSPSSSTKDKTKNKNKNGETSSSSFSIEPPFSAQTQEVFRSKIVSCLNTIIAGRQDFAHTIPFNVVKKIHEKYQKQSWGDFHIEMDEKSEEAIDSAFKTLKKIAHKVVFLFFFFFSVPYIVMNTA